MKIKCVVACTNSNGDPDFYFTYVDATQEDIENGEHYGAANDAAIAEGYEPSLTYDENDTAGKALVTLFVWESAPTVVLPFCK